MLDHTQAVIGCAVGGVTLVAALVAWVRWWRPQVKRWAWERQAKNDVLIGRPAVLDSITGKELAPALPGVGLRIDTLAETVAKLADNHVRIEDHEARIKALEAARVERVVAQAESAQMWRAVGNREFDKQPPEDN